MSFVQFCFKTLGGAERQLTLHAYIWDALKGAHRMAPAQLDDLCRRLLGDQKLSLNPRMLHKKQNAPVVPKAGPATVGPAPCPVLAPLLPVPAPVGVGLDAPLASLAVMPKAGPKIASILQTVADRYLAALGEPAHKKKRFGLPAAAVKSKG